MGTTRPVAWMACGLAALVTAMALDACKDSPGSAVRTCADYQQCLITVCESDYATCTGGCKEETFQCDQNRKVCEAARLNCKARCEIGLSAAAAMQVHQLDACYDLCVRKHGRRTPRYGQCLLDDGCRKLEADFGCEKLPKQ